LRRSIALIGTTLFAAYLVFRFSLQRLFQLMGIAFAFFVILSYSYSIYYPNTFMWTGVFFTKNELTRTSILAMLVFGYCLFATKKIIWGVFLLGAIGLIFKSNSATGNIIFFLILVLFFLFVLTRHLTKIRKADIFIIAGLLALLSAVLILVNPSHIFAFFQKDITLTGRVPLWILVWNAILQKPLLGYGYGGFWLGWEGPSAYIRSIIQWHPPHAHNGFLDIMLDLGATGLLLYLLFLLSLVRQFSINRQTTYLFRLFTILLTIFLIIYNTVENIALSRNSIVWILGVVVLLQNSIILKTGE
jgi:O-antigen ligase